MMKNSNKKKTVASNSKTTNNDNKKKLYKLNPKQLDRTCDVWDKWPVKSQIYRYTQMLAKEEELVQDVLSEHDDFQARFLFDSEQERNEFIKEMLVDLKFKVLFFLHVLIESQDKESIMFALKELLQKGFVQEELEKIDDGALQQIQDFFEAKTSQAMASGQSHVKK